MRPLGQASSKECSLSVWGHWGLWAWEWGDLVRGWDRPPCAGPHGKEGVDERAGDPQEALAGRLIMWETGVGTFTGREYWLPERNCDLEHTRR